jgi:hypothetical protein
MARISAMSQNRIGARLRSGLPEPDVSTSVDGDLFRVG